MSDDVEPAADLGDAELVADLDDPRWTCALERVLGGEGVDLVAQPIIDVAHARVGGYEMLSRFAGPPSRPPDVWFQAARRRGLDAELTARVVTLARGLAGTRPRGTFWTVNVEPHLLTVPVVQEALLGAGRIDDMVVELTEHVLGDDTRLPGVLAEIRALGGRVAMDDAGTGYSGLSQMLQIRPDIVKVDRSLVSGLDQDPVRRAAVRLLGDLAGQMDSFLLAEGVETRSELQELTALGVPLAQGWAVGRPAPVWPDLDAGTADFLRAHVARRRLGDHVLPLVRAAAVHQVPAMGPRGRVEAAADTALAVGDVVVDRVGRPVSVVVHDPDGLRHLVPALVVAPSTPPLEVLQRAMSRAAAWQHAPVVCTDARGDVIGTVAVAGLVDHVVQSGRVT